MYEMKVNRVQKLFPPIECKILKTESRSRWISVNLDDIKHDRFVEARGSVVATVELADRDFDRMCYRSLRSRDYPFVSQVYGRKRKILKNDAERDEFEVIHIENDTMGWLYMAVRQYGSIPLFSKQLLNIESLWAWEKKFDAMEKFVHETKVGYLEDRLYSDPDIPPSKADLIVAAMRDGRVWGDSFEGGLSLYSAVSHHIHSSIDEAAEKYLDGIYGKSQIQAHKDSCRHGDFK